MTPPDVVTETGLSLVSKLAEQLVRIPSVSGSEEELAVFVESLLAPYFFVERVPAGSRFSLLAVRGEPTFLLNIHLDTVPGEVSVRIEDGKLFGRGAVDAKGPLACMLRASIEAAREGYTNFCLALSVGEETDSCGTEELVRRSPAVDLVVVGEPTGCNIRTGQKGILEAELVSHGVASHSSLPELGENAIRLLIDAVRRVEDTRFPEDPVLGKTTVACTMIQGGESSNTIPSLAHATLNARLSTQDDIVSLLRERAGGVELVVHRQYPPVLVDDMNLISSVLDVVQQVVPDTGVVVRPGFTEMFFWSKKSPCLVIGPGDSTLSHTSNEHILLDELDRGVLLYKALIKQYGSI